MADVEEILRTLTLAEKAALTAGEDFFSTPAIERVGIPKVRLTDGPNGARGTDAFPGLGGTPSACVPCGSAIGASWDPELAEQVGALLAREARDRGCRVLLAPTVNLHRSPLGGRDFECYSEDPLLSGRLAVGFVRGVQSEGVVATVKHFVANDAEFERMTISSVVDERSLRELYLLPFELAVKDGGALAIMSAYNRLNGRYLNEQGEFLLEILRGEWGFAGLVMTDWFATVMTDRSLAAGLDLEMPGPGRSYGATLVDALDHGQVSEADLDAAVRRVLSTWEAIGVLGEPTPPIAPKPPTEADVALMRRASAESSVLLTNDGILPLSVSAGSRVAVIGANAVRPQIMGGGSAGVIPHKREAFADALSELLGPEVELGVARGCEIDLAATVIGTDVLRAPEGFEVEVYAGTELAGDPVSTRRIDDLRVVAFNSLRSDWPDDDFSLRVTGRVVPDEGGAFALALAQAGRTRVFLDGDLVLDGVMNPPPPGGSDFFGLISQELITEVELSAGVAVEIVVEYAKVETMLAGFRVGFRTLAGDALIEQAVAVARDAEVAIVVVGTSAEWETEGRDRTSMALPGRQDELIVRVAAANSRTVVVVNAGAPVDMPWVDEVAAVVVCWLGGQEMPGGMADVLVGRSDPAGRLPMTIPVRLEHNPSHDNFPGENGELRYGEGLFMGYRGYEHRWIEPRFPFGHGLSYTTFAIDSPAVSAISVAAGETVTVSARVTNTGKRAGSAVIQCYVAPPAGPLVRPPKELKGFAKVTLAPAQSTNVDVVLDARAFAAWNPARRDREAKASQTIDIFGSATEEAPPPQGWVIEPGIYQVMLATSSADVVATLPVTITTAIADSL